MSEDEELEGDDQEGGDQEGGDQEVDEQEVDEQEAESSSGDRAPVNPVLRGGTMVLLILIGSLVGGALFRWVGMIVSPADEPAEIVEVRPTPDVITAVRDLARLETTSYHVERVIDLTSRQSRLFGLVQAEDSILLVAASDVVAGVDLGELEDGDVTIEPDHNRALITLPPPQIFSARLDNERTYVYQRQTDALARRRQNLETQARQEAERTLRAAAIEGGILERAERNARTSVEGLVRSLGYDEVIVRFSSDGAQGALDRD